MRSLRIHFPNMSRRLLVSAPSANGLTVLNETDISLKYRTHGGRKRDKMIKFARSRAILYNVNEFLLT
jgi:hypothetical protein